MKRPVLDKLESQGNVAFVEEDSCRVIEMATIVDFRTNTIKAKATRCAQTIDNRGHFYGAAGVFRK